MLCQQDVPGGWGSTHPVQGWGSQSGAVLHRGKISSWIHHVEAPDRTQWDLCLIFPAL